MIIATIIKLKISVQISDICSHASTLHNKLQCKAKQKFDNQMLPEICLCNCHKELVSRSLDKKICIKYMKKLQANGFCRVTSKFNSYFLSHEQPH